MVGMTDERKTAGRASMVSSGIKYGFSSAGKGITAVFYWLFRVLYYIVKFGKWVAGIIMFLYLLSNNAYEWHGGTWKDLSFEHFRQGLTYIPSYLKAKGAFHDTILWIVLIVVAVIVLGFVQLILHKIYLKFEEGYATCSIAKRDAQEVFRDSEVIAAYGRNREQRVSDVRKSIGDRYIDR